MLRLTKICIESEWIDLKYLIFHDILFNGEMSEQLEIPKIFNENMKLKEKLLSEEDKTWWEI